MKREALIRELRAIAKKKNLFFEVITREGKGSHYRVYLGDKATTLKSGEIDPFLVKSIKKQLGL